MERLAFMFLLCSFGAEIIEKHQDNLWSLSALKYFWLKEPMIIKKIIDVVKWLKEQTGNISVPRKTGEPKGVFQKSQNKNICLTNLNVANKGNFHFISFD